MNKLLIAICLAIILVACKSNSKSGEDSSAGSWHSIDEEAPSSGYPDGEYCATVEYDNSETGTSSTYSLTVHVEDGELTQIDWPNGGWLDSSHFFPPDVDEDGSCSFSTDDGKDYSIQIDEEGGCSGNLGFPEDDEEEEAQRLEEEEEEEQRQKDQEDEEERLEEEQREEAERQRELEEERQKEVEERNTEENSTFFPAATRLMYTARVQY